MRRTLILFHAALAFIASMPGIAIAAVERAIEFVFDVLASPRIVFAGVGRVDVSAAPLAYDAPPIHSLRHEAGVSRRSAARHI